MKTVFCYNVFDNVEKLQQTIETHHSLFPTALHIVASNGVDTLPTVPSTAHVVFYKWGENQGWQLGALNGMIRSIQLACTLLPDIESYTIFFSHDDVRICNFQKVRQYKEEIESGKTDVVLRSYIGARRVANTRYYMFESFLISGAVAKQAFTSLKLITTIPCDAFNAPCPEMVLGEILRTVNVNEINFEQNCDMQENEMGYFHDHKH